MNLTVTLFDYLDVDEGQVQKEGHRGVGCECKLCEKLKNIEDDWIIRLGPFYYPGGVKQKGQNQKNSQFCLLKI